LAPHLVAKIGGSLWRSPQLGAWIAALRRFPYPLTIVPGGGPFADAVRAAQPVMGFSNGAAHGMALLAMEQYALALADVHAGLALVSTPQEAARVHARGGAALWRPFAMVRGASDIAASWDVTSDSLAAWYALQAGASALLLIKSVDVDSSADLVSKNIVDPSFTEYVIRKPTNHRAEADSPPPCGGGLGWGVEETMRDRATPSPCPSPQGGGEMRPQPNVSAPDLSRDLPVFVAGPKALATAAHDFSQGNVSGARLDLAHLNQKIAS